MYEKIGKILLSSVLTVCFAMMPFGSALVHGETAAPLDLMPVADDGYTIVEGDGTVAIEDGVLTVVNNGDGDFRLTIDNTTRFDLSALNTLHMQFHAEMPFKMAYHIVSDVDSSNDWLTTSTEYTDIFELDAAADRAAAGEYDAKMNLHDFAVDLTDKSSVYFEQFIILITGKGTFTLNAAQMIAVESNEPVEDEPAADAPADEDTTTSEEPADDATTTKGAASEEDADDAAASSNSWLPIIIIVIAVVIIGVAVVLIVKRRKA